jgi:hypothetical protein
MIATTSPSRAWPTNDIRQPSSLSCSPAISIPAWATPSLISLPSSSILRPRKYLALLVISTRSAPRPAISPSRTKHHRCGHRLYPTKHRRPWRGRRPFMISNNASNPASLWARSITTLITPLGTERVEMFIRPGLSWLGSKERRPSATCSTENLNARVAEATARTSRH